jgi:hypothetical protein
MQSALVNAASIVPADRAPIVVGGDFARASLRGTSADGRLPPRVDASIRWVRAASAAMVVVALWFWLARATGTIPLAAFALTAGIVLACLAYGEWLASVASRILVWQPGVALELLLGFLFCNTLLFVLMLASPLGIGVHVASLGVGAVACVMRRDRRPVPGRTLDAERGSLACIGFTALAVTLWVREAQPVMSAANGSTVFTVWYDVFIHVREISAFAQSHGLSSISDIKLAGNAAPVYHFASYMMPAALDTLTSVSALDAYVAFQLPFGILLVGLAAYVLPAVVLKSTWPAVFAAAAVVALPDAYEQGFGIRYLSFHFMSQVNPGMLYGIACIAMSWLFMIEACRRDRAWGVVASYVLLAACVMYKAHLFVANAMILMLYPCLYFGRGIARIRWQWRVVLAAALCALFVAVVAVAQSSPRMPTFRLDGSGIGDYVYILMGGTSEGRLKDAFRWLSFENGAPSAAWALLVAALIVFGSFGLWIAAAPLVFWKTRRLVDRRAWAFVLIVVVNYMVMSMGLALDQQGVGEREELVNRPQAWAYFVVVVFVAGGAALALARSSSAPPLRMRLLAASIACLMLWWVFMGAQRLQTVPEWEAYADYADFNTSSTCLVSAAQYVRGHARPGDHLQDSSFDPQMRVTAIAERQSFVAQSFFGGDRSLVAERVAAVDAVQATKDGTALTAWARANRVVWYVMRPEDSDGWDGRFLEQAVFRCDGYRVFRFGS